MTIDYRMLSVTLQMMSCVTSRQCGVSNHLFMLSGRLTAPLNQHPRHLRRLCTQLSQCPQLDREIMLIDLTLQNPLMLLGPHAHMTHQACQRSTRPKSRNQPMTERCTWAQTWQHSVLIYFTCVNSAIAHSFACFTIG